MKNELLYTDVIIDELSKQVYTTKEAVKYITEKYTEEEFTESDLKKERRYVRQKIQSNCSSLFDMISGITLSIIGGLVAYLLANNIFARGSFLKVFLPLVVTSVLLTLFIYLLVDSREKVKLYNICIDVLDKIEKAQEKEKNKIELSQLFDKDIKDTNSTDNLENVDTIEIDAIESEDIDEFEEVIGI